MEMTDALRELVSYRSISEPEGESYPYGKETDRAKNFVLDLAKELGMRAVDVLGKYAYVEIGEGEELIGILSHLDVVPEGDGWTRAPFGGEVTEDRIYGRGTTDDKGPTIAVLYAMKDLMNSNPQRLTKRIRLILGQCEENGKWEDIQAYKEKEELPSCGFTPDGDFPAIQCELGATVFRVTMPLAESGILYATGGTASNMVPASATIRTAGGEYAGDGVTCHGCAPWLGVNAISKAMHQIAEEEDAAFATIYDALIGETIYGEKLGIACKDESGPLTLNVGTISSEENMLTMMIDIRYPASHDGDVMIQQVRNEFREKGCGCECIYHAHPQYTPSASPVLHALLRAYRDVTHDNSEPISIGGGTYAKAMPHIVAFGPNFPGHENREHREDEYILLSDFRMLREIYRKAIENLLAIEPGLSAETVEQ
jgi:succinyl-diaminopimelate desuccinylase